MKKIITLSALIVSMLTLAGPKADLEKAKKLIQENKEKEAVKVLRNSKEAKGEEKEFEKINFNLGQYYLSNKNNEEAIKYLEKVSKNTSSKTNEAKASDDYLYQLSKTNSDKIKYLERLSNRLDNKNMEMLVGLVLLNEKENNSDKIKEILKKAKSNGADFLDQLYLFVAQEIIMEDYNKADKYIDKALKSKNPKVLASTHFLLAAYNLEKGNEDKAISEMKKSESSLPNDAETLFNIAELYRAKGDLKENYNYLKKSYKLSPKEPAIILNLMLNSFKQKNTKEENKWLGILRNTNKEYTDLNIAAVFLENSELQISEKYAKKAVKKDGKANLLLSYIYFQENKKDLAITYAKKALKVKETKATAEEFLKQLQK